MKNINDKVNFWLWLKARDIVISECFNVDTKGTFLSRAFNQIHNGILFR